MHNYFFRNLKPFYYIIFFILVAFSSFINAAEYKLNSGDTISIIVFNEEDMTVRNVRIPKQGVITFPYLGEIKVSGLTLRKLKKKLIKKLKKGYLKKPELVINIESYRPFFVNGQVNSPGGYPYVDGLTVRKAIAIAGGLTDRATLKKVSLVAEGKKTSKKIDKSLDVPMNAGDVLTIGESLF